MTFITFINVLSTQYSLLGLILFNILENFYSKSPEFNEGVARNPDHSRADVSGKIRIYTGQIKISRQQYLDVGYLQRGDNLL